MDRRLHERLDLWHKHIEDLAVAEKQYLSLEANEKSMFSALFLGSTGKNVSEREAAAYVHDDWVNFKAGLVEAQVAFNKKRRELELKQSAFNSEYLTCKNEHDAIQRHPKGLT